MRRRVRDAVHRHYSGLELEILLDYDFDEVIEAIAEYHQEALERHLDDSGHD